ncbi:MAG TPA: bifunctional enoyl-CoA hydratase/phosphate acetyltransferase [Gammaproteobacteria bacterium]|nr:bifunctional enoyl-CoA hydratase/phosphate acetyltransferase [Gammaproteobacteria bacterium]
MSNNYAGDCPRLNQFIAQARQYPAIRVAVIDAGESHVLQGMMEAHRDGLVEPVLIGKRRKIQRLSEQLGFDLTNIALIDAETEAQTIAAGIDLVKQQQADALAKGWIHTDTLMHPVLRELGVGRRVSHVFVAEMPSYHKLLFITDAAINITPNLQIKANIVENAVYLARRLGLETPKVAALSAVEVVKPAIVSTIDAACLSKMAQRGQIRHAIIDGPLAFDNAISAEAARIKKIESPVAGDVDILLAPDLNAANILAKDLEYLASATLAGLVIGARVPILLPSRSDPPQARRVAAALASIIHASQPQQPDEM